ncbi:MAG: hypothetical protein JO126_02400 [Alphaproteobacteria bacterium]|nr:hypothetical protein [Alphaproteobacteria bacterium]
MTCPICAYQANPSAKVERGTVCDVHADDFFPPAGKTTKSAEQLLTDYGIPSHHELVPHIQDICARRDRAVAFLKAFIGGRGNDHA